MAIHTYGTGIKLSGQWNISGLVYQMESLSDLFLLESDQGKHCHIDCSDIRSVDMSGLQLLYVWMQCVTIRGIKPELINLPEGMQQAIKQLGLVKCFSEFYTNA